MFTQHLTALQIVIPLLAAPLCVLAWNHRIAWAIAALTGIACSIISLALLLQVNMTGTIVYSLGGWAAPWGIEYRIDYANVFVLLIISFIYLAGIIYAPKSISAEVPQHQQKWLYTAWILCFMGLSGITVSGDVFNVFVFLEISSLSSYILISLGKDRRCLTAALRYLFMGTVAATFFLIGIGLLYALTGTLNMADLAERVPQLAGNRTAQTAFIFVIMGLGIKIAVFPLHYWLPNAYAYAPNAVTVFLAGTSTKAAVYVFARMIFGVFTTDFALEFAFVFNLLVAAGIAGALIASTIAFFQTNLKRLFAWSSIGQIGYMVIGIGLASVPGVAASFVHLFNHALMKSAAFMAIGGLILMTGTASMESLTNAGRRMPWTTAAIVVAGLSLIGVPFTTGFISKWYLVSASLEGGLWWLAGIVLIGSLITAAYVWKIVEAAYFRKNDTISVQRSEAPAWLLVPTWVLVIANIYFGIHATFTGSQAIHAANSIMRLIR